MAATNTKIVHQIADLISAFVTTYQIAEWQKDNGNDVGKPAVVASNAVVENSGKLVGFMRTLVSQFISVDGKLNNNLEGVGQVLKSYADAIDGMNWMVDGGIKLDGEVEEEAYSFAVTFSMHRDHVDRILSFASKW
ncbi:hypothetical protein [Vibrio owensii]|uniref:hypothetical protein n=1 Tax=Vibrio harveyi group TaxID=717610 RepID=UPI003CC58DDD